MTPIVAMVAYTYKHLLHPCLTVEPRSCGAFLFNGPLSAVTSCGRDDSDMGHPRSRSVSASGFLTALADGGLNRLLAFAFSPRLPVSATLAGLFLALSSVEGE